jgi:ATP-dependent DNA helicase RecQ
MSVSSPFNPGQISAVLADIFGFRSFRPHQEEIVHAVLSGNDVFAVMPTGGGKSLCYQLPARLLSGVCIVVSPLLSLMKDQVDAAQANGLNAAALNSATSPNEKERIRSALRQNTLDLLYISPERFNSEHFIGRLKTLKISFFAIDEAHCISEWGHDFRPDYLALSRIVTEFPGIPVAAFTATATPRVAEDIVQRLGLRQPYLTRASFNRPNLFYRVVMKGNLDEQLKEYLAGHSGESGIIYRISRKKTEQTAEMLQANGFSARAYHAGMSDAARHEAQEAFSKDECSIIVATIAFGMGIDKSNVRFVVHADLPKNVEGYYQETGRAGRDGEPADCTLFFSRQDTAMLRWFAEQIDDADQKEIAKTQLRQMVQYAEYDRCRRAALLQYFGEEFTETPCSACDVCGGIVEREDATVAAQKVLSAIYRTQEKFGAVHLTDILVGANTEKIRQFQHDTLPTYGVGKDLPKAYWRTVIDSLTAQKIIVIDDLQRPAPKLTPDAWQILKGQKTFQMVKWQDTRKEKTRLNSFLRTRTALEEVEPYSEPLFAVLRNIRTEFARKENVPPFVVFSDRTLHEMARYFPRNKDELLQISGVGQHKLDVYGEQFLSAINEFCQQNPDSIENLQRPKPVEMKPATIAETSSSALETYQLARQGKTIDEIAQERGLARSTIISHLEQAMQAGQELSELRKNK